MADVVLVAGASGYLGRRVVGELRGRGVVVRALVRSHASQAAAELASSGADVVAVDATRPGALVGVCDGCFAVVSCMAADASWTSGTPEAVDRDANIALFQEAASTASRAPPASVGGGSERSAASWSGGVRRFVLVAAFEGREARSSVPLHEAKEAAVDFIQEFAPEHGISCTVLRPTAYFKDFTDLPWRQLQHHNWMVVPGGGRARYNPIDGAELAAFTADCMLDPTAEEWADREARIGGPQVITFRDTILAAAQALGKRPDEVLLISIPVLALRVAALIAGMLGMLWSPAARLAAGLRFLLYSATHDAVGMRYGRRTVADHYKELRQQMDAEQGPGRRRRGRTG